MPAILRSLLFTPAHHARRVAKALAGETGADGVVLDLEDAVGAAAKDEARAAVRLHLAERRGPHPALFVRVNGLGTPHAYADIQAAVAPGLDGLLLPKVERASEVAVADWLLQQLERAQGRAPGSLELLPLVETAAGLARLAEIAGASARVRRVMFGGVDFASDTGMAPGGEGLLWARAALVAGCRAAGLEPPIDTVFTDLADTAGFAREAAEARRLGFQGKACIHPSQVAAANAAFTPTPAEVDEARRILAAFRAAGGDAIQVAGRLVEAPVVERARRILALAGRGEDGAASPSGSAGAGSRVEAK